jgi:hypothetical protein
MKKKNDILKQQLDAFKGQEINATTHIQGGKNPDTGGGWIAHTYKKIGGIDHEGRGDLELDWAVAAEPTLKG